jgi:hypothetical protein
MVTLSKDEAKRIDRILAGRNIQDLTTTKGWVQLGGRAWTITLLSPNRGVRGHWRRIIAGRLASQSESRADIRREFIAFGIAFGFAAVLILVFETMKLSHATWQH